MGQDITPNGTLRDVYQALFRHKGKACVFFLTVVAFSVAATILWPRAYRSEGKLFVRLGRENVTLDPTVTLGKDSIVAIPQSRDNEINSVVEILKSRSLIEKLVDAIGTEAILGRAWLAKRDPSAGVGDRDRAIRRLAQRLDVAAVKKSNIIEVSYEGQSPELSQTIVATLIEFYLDEHVRLNRTHGAHEFLSEQTARLGESLAQAEQQLRDLKNETGLASLAGQREILVTRIGRLEDDLLRTTNETITAQNKVTQLRQMLDELPEKEVTTETSGFPNQGTDTMRGQFYALQLAEQEARAKYTEAHPKMQEIARQAAASRQILDRQEPIRTQVTTAQGKVAEEVRLALVQQEPLVSAMRAKTESLRTQLAALRGELRGLNENELRIAKLEREVELQDANYRKYSANLEQARIDQALQTQRMSNISIVQPATYEAKPVRPRVALNVALGLLAGVLGSLALTLLMERLDHSFRTPEDIERRLELPALVSIPRFRAKRLAANGRS